jgi:hypothetical protein
MARQIDRIGDDGRGSVRLRRRARQDGNSIGNAE